MAEGTSGAAEEFCCLPFFPLRSRAMCFPLPETPGHHHHHLLLLRRHAKSLLRAAAAGGGGGPDGKEARRALARFPRFWVGMSQGGPAGANAAAAAGAAHAPRASTSTRRPTEHARGIFSEDQFLAVCRELAKPREGTSGSWQLMADSQGFKIYRQYDEKSGLYEYKLYGILDDCSPELCADVYMDLNYRPKWDQFVRDICEKTHDGRSAIYWEVKFPFPLTNRDYVFTRERQDMEVDGKKIYVILAKSVSTHKFPEKSGIVRVKSYRQSVAFESDGKKGSKVFMYYFDDPGGKLPSWLVNWATKTGVPNFLKDMQKACHTYHKK